MGPHMVRHDQVARASRRPEARLHIRLTDGSIRCPCTGHRGVSTRQREGREQRQVRPIVRRHRADAPLAPRRTAKPARHGQVDAGLIDEPQALEVEGRDEPWGRRSCLLDPRRVTCRGVTRRFGRGKPSRCRTRPSVGPLARALVSVARRVPSAANVASGWSSTHLRTWAWAAASRRGRCPPAGGLGATSPVVRWRRRSCSTTERLTPKMSAIAGGEPSRRSQAGRICCRQSIESVAIPES